MDRRQREALDRHITGNYGEDQFTDGELCGDYWDEPECQVSGCPHTSEDGVLCADHNAEARSEQAFMDYQRR